MPNCNLDHDILDWHVHLFFLETYPGSLEHFLFLSRISRCSVTTNKSVWAVVYPETLVTSTVCVQVKSDAFGKPHTYHASTAAVSLSSRSHFHRTWQILCICVYLLYTAGTVNLQFWRMLDLHDVTVAV